MCLNVELLFSLKGFFVWVLRAENDVCRGETRAAGEKFDYFEDQYLAISFAGILASDLGCITGLV